MRQFAGLSAVGWGRGRERSEWWGEQGVKFVSLDIN